MTLKDPVIYEIPYKDNFYDILTKELKNEDQELIKRFPTVYIIHNEQFSKHYTYVGETTSIQNRTLQHLKDDIKSREDFKKLKNSQNSQMFVIGHNHFNKSLTLDIENRLIHYLSSIDDVEVNNRRYNQQSSYYPVEEFEEIFSKVWLELRRKNKKLFPLEKVIRDSALFKASPFHKLTEEQFDIREKIILKISSLLSQEKTGQLILVEGEAGAGKTVLMSSLFYELNQLSKDDSENPIINKQGNKQFLLVNHDQQLIVYQQLAKKLGLTRENINVVSKPTKFINSTSPNDKADIVIVDEAHLLWTQGKQSYRGKNQLNDLLERAKVVVAVFDKHQVMSREQYMENDDYLDLAHNANLTGNHFFLNNQLRINADNNTVKWIRDLVDFHDVNIIHKDSKGYELKIFENPTDMYQALEQKAKDEKNGISRLLASFDWEYKDATRPTNAPYWTVKIGNFEMPWNLQLPKGNKDKNKSWAEQKQTINEVGSTFTIQGFDLNYAGVIIGPSVSYKDGKIVFDSSKSKNKKAIQKRTLKNGKKQNVAEVLLQNELNVLLTRGVNGLYVYAVDSSLREALLKAQERGTNDNNR